MKIFLVGGAVRDELLGLPITERDYVVVGSTAEEMKSRGYLAVGKSFPVFLHPDTREEYALARKERKSGKGYYGFVCDFSKDVSLEEDLLRRDLTINAMAKELVHNQLIDPYHGHADLEAKKLRHVSEAFVEDPVRVLRVARFYARFKHLGFTVADETKVFMRNISQSTELDHLIPERVGQELLKTLSTKNPEAFFDLLDEVHALPHLFPEFLAIFEDPAWKKIWLDRLKIFSENAYETGYSFTVLFLTTRSFERQEVILHHVQTLTDRLRLPKTYEKLAKNSVQFFETACDPLHQRPEVILNMLTKTRALHQIDMMMIWIDFLFEVDHHLNGTNETTIALHKKFWQSVLEHLKQVDVVALAESHRETLVEQIHSIYIERIKDCLKLFLNATPTVD